MQGFSFVAPRVNEISQLNLMKGACHPKNGKFNFLTDNFRPPSNWMIQYCAIIHRKAFNIKQNIDNLLFTLSKFYKFQNMIKSKNLAWMSLISFEFGLFWYHFCCLVQKLQNSTNNAKTQKNINEQKDSGFEQKRTTLCGNFCNMLLQNFCIWACSEVIYHLGLLNKEEFELQKIKRHIICLRHILFTRNNISFLQFGQTLNLTLNIPFRENNILITEWSKKKVPWNRIFRICPTMLEIFQAITSSRQLLTNGKICTITLAQMAKSIQACNRLF